MKGIVKLSPIVLMVFSGCAASCKTGRDPQDDVPLAWTLTEEVTSLCDRNDYVEALRLLPKAMDEWEAYTARTGNTCEGAAGYLYAETIWSIAHKGDAQWGSILDDEAIPYRIKVELISEICEARIGKGSVQMDQDGNIVLLTETE